MTSKKQQEEEARKARMLALVAGGAEHFRDAQSPPKAEPAPPATETPAPVPELPPPPPANPAVRKPVPVRAAATRRVESAPETVEEPVLGPEAEDPAQYLVKRRKSLRDDPQWTGTTLYLRRETHAALQEFCRGAGLDMSRVVQFCVASQMDESKRSPVLTQLLGD